MARSDLIRWLGSLDAEDLAGLLARRPDATTDRVPRDLGELADRLTQRIGVLETLGGLPLPAVELLEGLQALTPASAEPLDRDGIDRTRLAALFGRPADDPELDAALQVLAQRALAWTFENQVFVSPALRHAFEFPFGLGQPAVHLLDEHSVTDLRRIARRLGLPGTGVKAQIAAAVAAWLSMPEHVLDLLERAPDATRKTLATLAEGPPILEIQITFGWSEPIRWAIDHGLLAERAYGVLELPREVGLAVRGPAWRAPLTPVPPSPRLTPIDPAAVRGEAGNAASDLLDRMTGLVEECAKAPASELRTGGVGARELRRLAKATGIDEPAARLLLEIAVSADLVAPGPGGILPTAEFDEWLAQDPATQLTILLTAWYAMPAIALDGNTEPALLHDPAGPLAAELRPVLLRTLDELPPGTGVTDTDAFFSLVRWSAPLPLRGRPAPNDLLEGLWNELVAVGACAHGAISPLGRALVEATPVIDAAARMLRSVVSTARFQADLTAVVGGMPAPPLRETLDASADREARGAASIWRFSADSVRRALDAGTSTVDLLARLRAVAVGGELPQPLEYLINDVGRRHGVVRIRPVGCVICAEDTALLAEIAGARALAALKLVALAPTVLASAAPPATALEALRKAGYAPSIEDKRGALVVDRPAKARAQWPGRITGAAASRRSTVDVDALATRLLAVPPLETTPEDVHTSIARRAPQLSERAVRLLAAAVERGTLVRIDYTDTKGQVSTRTIEQAALDGRRLEAWCHLRGDERSFQLDRIDAVYPI